MNHLKWVFTIFFVVIALSSIWLLDYTKSVMYADVSFMRVYYFLFMLLGAMTAISKRKERTPLRAGVYTIISVGLYYVCIGKLQIGFYVMQVSTDIINATIIYYLLVVCVL